MTRRLALTVLLALGAPAAARGETTTIAMPASSSIRRARRSSPATRSFPQQRPRHARRADRRRPFDSRPILRFTSWSQSSTRPGGYPFVCTLHPFMSGNLDVVAATLAAAPDGVLAGEPLELLGRAPAGTARSGSRVAVGGEWSAVGDGAAPAADGMFATRSRPSRARATASRRRRARARPSHRASRRAWTSTSWSSARAGIRPCACTRCPRRQASPPRWSSTRAGTSAGARRGARSSTRRACHVPAAGRAARSPA